MSFDNPCLHNKFGIDEIYIHDGFENSLREKLHQRALLCLDGEDNVVLKYASHDMILIYRNHMPNQSLIYRFLKTLDQYTDRDNYIGLNTLVNEDELFQAVKSTNFVFVTPSSVIKEIHTPLYIPK